MRYIAWKITYTKESWNKIWKQKKQTHVTKSTRQDLNVVMITESGKQPDALNMFGDKLKSISKIGEVVCDQRERELRDCHNMIAELKVDLARMDDLESNKMIDDL